MAEAVVSLALQTLRDLLLEEAKFLTGVSGEARALEKQLKEIKCLLEDADKRQQDNKTISNWIAEIRALAQRSEDAIETYAVQISSKRGPGFKKLLGRFSCGLGECFSLHQIGSEISEIKSEIARVKESMKEFGIKNIIEGECPTAGANDNQRWKRQTFPVESDDCFVGKDDDLKQLVSLIVDDKQKRVISIWGMGGIGKTTIARKVYNHADTRRYFECFAWVCITQQCHGRSVWEDVLKQLIPQKRVDISSLTDTDLNQELCQIQTTRRCLVVLDDLWEVEHWHDLKRAFLVGDSNSKVLLTTRKQNVANMEFAFELGLLKSNDGWELLKKKAFPYDNIPDNFAMDEKLFAKHGKEMVLKCGYLPLVISILGGLLSKRKSIEEWVSVNESMNSHVYREENEIHGVLKLSYEDLPFYLKPCFLVMGQFREDEKIHCRGLYRMWISHGMISHEHREKDEKLMDVAEAYLSELASRCLIQIKNDLKLTGKYFECQLHDAVRELCLSEGKNEGFNFRVINYRGGDFSSLLNELLLGNKIRHLSIHFEGRTATNPDGLKGRLGDNRKYIRSLQFLNSRESEKIEFQQDALGLEELELLRVLVFMNFRLIGRQLKGIGKLIHLRLLVLRSCELEELPSSIRNLEYLHTIDLYSCWNVRVPNVLKEMHRLKYLLLPFYEGEWIARNNYHLTLEGLGELEILDNFNSLVHDWKSVVTMKNLYFMGVEVHDNESLFTVINAVKTNWANLRTFRLDINIGCHLESIVKEGLVILKNVLSCQTLNQLVIHVPVRKLQLGECVTEISNSRLVSLTLDDCQIEDDPMQILGKFPFLEFLSLIRRAFVGKKMKCHASGFPRLKIIELRSLPKLREWTVEPGAMPLLSSIVTINCPQLEMIPDGLRFIRNLQELTILEMPELGRRVDAEGGEDFDKVRHVSSIIIG